MINAKTIDNQNVDTRKPLQKKIDEFSLYKENKTQLPQNQLSPFSYNQVLNTSPSPILLKRVNNQFYGEYDNLNYSAGNIILTFNSNTNNTINNLNYNSIDNIKISFLGTFSVRPNALTFASDFEFKIGVVFGSLGINLNGEYDYSENPIYSKNVGIVKYNSIANTFSIIPVSHLVDISTINNGIFDQLTKQSIVFYAYSGIINESLTNAQLTFLNNINIFIQNNITPSLLYFGLSKQDIRIF